MIRFALRGLLSRKLRTALTAIGIVLGVSLVSGTYVLTDSITSAFDSITSENYKNTDAAITGKPAFELDAENGPTTGEPFDQALLGKVSGLPEVAAADGNVSGEAQLIGRDGKAIVFGGAPNLGFSVNPERPEFNSLSLLSGAWPKPGEVVIDRRTARDKGFATGDTVRVQSRGPAREMRISGLVEFGAVESIGGATLAGFELGTAQELFGKTGKLDQILVSAKDGVSQQQLLDSIRPVLPQTVQVRSGEEQASKEADDISGFLGFLRTFLLVFGGVALFVGSFVIANALSITIAQRTREFATLRTLGATRRQLLGTVVLEALVTGIVASAAGLFLGLGIASGLFNLFDAVGFTLPNNGLEFRGRTVVVALVVGVVVTLLASLRPAIRSTRVPPIAAVREGSKLQPGRLHRYRSVIAAAVAAIGVAFVVLGLFLDGLGTGAVLTLMMVGVLLLFVGIASFTDRLVRPMARIANPVARWSVVVLGVLVWPISFLVYLVRRLFGRRPEFPGVVPEAAATEIGGANSSRDPQRTASTAAALMIGLALVTLVAMLGTGIIRPFQQAVDQIFQADYAITAQNGFSPLPTGIADAVAKTPGVEAISSVRTAQARTFDQTIMLTAVDTQAPKVLSLDWKEGSQDVLGGLGRDGAVVDEGYATEHDLEAGSPISLQTISGTTLALTVKGIFTPPAGGSPFGRVTISTTAFDATNPRPQNMLTFLDTTGGVTAANTKLLGDALASFPNAKAQTRDEFKKTQTDGVKSILNILYVLLALSVVVSLFGIVNTLVLTVFERTRELGMLRAIGLTRRQVRRMIRHESVITALIGGAIGIVLGLALASLLAARLDEVSFAVPVGQLVVFAVVSVIVGIFAAIWPARRAARLNPLEALQYE